MVHQHLFLFSGGLAFSVIACMVPFFLVVLFLLGTLLDLPALDYQLRFVTRQISPDQSHARFIEEVLLTRVEGTLPHKNLYGVFGLAGLLFTSTSLFSTMRTILDTIFQTRPEPGGRVPWGKLKDCGMVVLVACAFLVSVACSPLLEALRQAAFVTQLDHILPNWIRGYLYPVGSFAFMAGTFFCLYLLIPHRRPNRRVALMSALSAAVSWEVAKQAFGYYLGHFATIEKVYGAYAVVAGLIFWIYFASIVFVLGAEIGQLYRERP
jgi:membrane protein